MNKLVNDLLVLARMENTNTSNNQKFDLSKEVQMAVSVFESMIYEKKIELETNISEFSNSKNRIFDLTKSRNYISKAEHFQGYLIKPYTMQPFLYYKIKIKDTAFCTYIDEHYSQHRVYYKLAQNSNNSTT